MNPFFKLFNSFSSFNLEYFENYLWHFIQIFSKQGFLFVLFFISAKLLSKSDFGLLNYWMTIFSFIVVFCDFGISCSVNKYVAEFNSTRSSKLKHILFPVIFYLFIVSSFILFCVILLKGFFNSQVINYIYYLIPVCFFLPLTSVLDGFFRGLKKFKFLALIYLFVGVCLVLISYFFIKLYGLSGVLVSYNLLYFSFSLILLFFVLPYFKMSFRFDVLKKVISYSFVIGFSLLSFLLFTKFDIMILGHYGFLKDIAYYELVNKIIQFVLIPFSIFSTIIGPDITKYFSLKKFDLVREKLLRYSFLIFLIGVIYSLVIYFIVPFILKFFLVEYYDEQTIHILKLFLLILPFLGLRLVFSGGFLTATGFAKFSFVSALLFGLINICLDFFLIGIYGLEGIILSTILCLFLSIILSYVLFYHKINSLVG